MAAAAKKIKVEEESDGLEEDDEEADPDNTSEGLKGKVARAQKGG